MRKPWTAYILHGDLPTLVQAWHCLRPLFIRWAAEAPGVAFSYNGYAEGLHPHLSIRTEDQRKDLEDSLGVLGLPISISTQPYDEDVKVANAYVLGSWLATIVGDLCSREPRFNEIDRAHLIHGFVNSLGFFHARDESQIYQRILESNDRLLKKMEGKGLWEVKK